MSSTKNLQLARILKVVLDIIFGALIFVSVGLALWTAAFGLISRQANLQSTASIPVILGTGEQAQLDVTIAGTSRYEINSAFLDETEGTLRLETKSPLLIGIANAAKLILAIGLAYIFYLLRAVVQAIRDGNPFGAENAIHIRRLGYTVLALGFVAPAVEHLAASEILRRIPTTIPVLSPGPSFDVGVILAALFILPERSFDLTRMWHISGHTGWNSSANAR